MIRMYFALAVARLAAWVIPLLHLGSGSTWPGQLALMIDGSIVRKLVQGGKLQVLLVAGTNGKTTTSSMIRTLIEKKTGERVIYNAEGANLLNGIASVLVARPLQKGAWCVFECDENALGAILEQTRPQYVVILNLFRDQLDRYGEVNTIAENWRHWFVTHDKTTYILNADDPLVWSLSAHTNAVAYGVDSKLMNKKALGHDVDSINCPVCRTPLRYDAISYSHLGAYTCPECGFTSPKDTKRYGDFRTQPYPLIGLYNRYNTHAALTVAEQAVGAEPQWSLKLLTDEFVPMFGRQEVVKHNNRDITLLLSKNPAGFNQSLDALGHIAQDAGVSVLLLLNDHIPDGRDVSWIWDVDMEPISQNKRVSVAFGGDRAYDMALRFAYDQSTSPAVTKENEFLLGGAAVIQDIPAAIDRFAKKAPVHDKLFIVTTYSGMLTARRHIVGDSFSTQS